MLDIYKASAGAGKTHKLTGEYIKLLFSKPYAFRNILAVTFTNKATDEMKQRILQELHLLAQPGVKSDYLEQIMELTGKDEAWVRGESRNILISILHDYTSFRVSTIDKFFQLVMRAFARELGRMATYNVELDKDEVLARAVDRMFADLDDPKNGRLLDWLIEYSLDAVDNGDSWNIKKDILKLGDELFSENFKLAGEKCDEGDIGGIDIEKIWEFKKGLGRLVDDFTAKAAALGKEGISCIAEAGLELADFKGGSRTPFNYLRTLSNIGRGDAVPPPADGFIALEDNLEKWYTGKKCPAGIEGVYGELNGIVGKIIAHFNEGFAEYATAVQLLGNVNVMGIINDIHARVLEYCREKNIILLSESTELLGRIIDGNDTPFIYEKIGARLDNFMLDEFQDTSSMQWRNFYPLLLNSLSQGYDNLIVGDVKQSIYRWRGSDWNILNEQIYREFRENQVKDIPLACNYRSGANIVEFNNSFFGYSAKAAGQLYGDGGGLIENIYNGHEQKIPQKKLEKPGCIEVDFLSNEEKGEFMVNALARLPQKVKQLLDNGYSQKDIAVLVRKGSEGKDVAQCLVAAGYDIISSDSLYISSSEPVQKVVNVLRQIDSPESDSLKVLRMFCPIPQPGEIERHSLYQLCEHIIRETLAPGEKGDVAYLQAFLDLVLDFTANRGTSIAQFIRWWDESGVKCTISAPEDMDAIRIITIHKSKGLGFEVVIVPFLKEALDHYQRTAPNLWCTYQGYPVPVKYTPKLMGTSFEDEYRKEKLCAYIDSLNTVYVAFTRPKQELHVFAPLPKRTQKGYEKPSAVSDILFAYYLNYKDEKGWTDGIRIGMSGNTLEPAAPVEKFLPGGVFAEPVDAGRTRTVAQSGTIGEGESIREHGIAMHYVFSLVDYKEGIPAAVKRACMEGVASCPEEELLEMVNSKVDSVEEYGWFGKDYKVFNECSILTPSGEQRRPDRVLVKDGEAIVVDYKFGAFSPEDTAQLGKYKKQVSRYKELLTSMGYSNVKGYLWYLSADKVICV